MEELHLDANFKNRMELNAGLVNLGPISWDVKRVRFGLRFGSVEDLEEVSRLCPHTRVDVRLGALDVVVQVVSEEVNQVNRVVAGLLVRVTWEENEGDITNLFAHPGVCSY
jgi:hypothetical protein